MGKYFSEEEFGESGGLMFRRRIAEYNLFGWILLGTVLLCTSPTAQCAEPESHTGTLRIEGAGIERLVLQGSTGPRLFYYSREPNLVLRADTYRLEEVVVQGNYSSSGLQIPAQLRVLTIEPGGLVTLTLGVPLRQTVRIERWGRSLVLNYQLLGRGGESYTFTQRHGATPPAFAIYQGERQVSSGAFAPS
jgi:hypothetical protein